MSALQSYRCVKGYGEAQFEINRSLFIGYASRAATIEEAVAFIRQIREKHPDATHNCAAYIVGKHSEQQKADDDGEPTGTAGKPILEVLKKQNLTDTVMVVTRYFGGIKLGAGGLIRAYGKGASEGVAAAGVVSCEPYTCSAVSCDYGLLSVMEHHLEREGYVVKEKTFAEQVTLYVLHRPKDEAFLKNIGDWSGGTACIKEAGEEYCETEL
jgi:uncharacterized YigZ family protein